MKNLNYIYAYDEGKIRRIIYNSLKAEYLSNRIPLNLYKHFGNFRRNLALMPFQEAVEF